MASKVSTVRNGKETTLDELAEATILQVIAIIVIPQQHDTHMMDEQINALGLS